MIVSLLKDQAKLRICGESIPRILKCLEMLSEDQVWYQFNENSNSIGNLILHLEGNATQWILNSFENIGYERQRDSEFLLESKIHKKELLERLNKLSSRLCDCFERLTTQQLESVYQVQCFDENGVSILIHVIEHFSYHTGQITYITKLLLNKQTEYYEGYNLG